MKFFLAALFEAQGPSFTTAAGWIMPATADRSALSTSFKTWSNPEETKTTLCVAPSPTQNRLVPAGGVFFLSVPMQCIRPATGGGAQASVSSSRRSLSHRVGLFGQHAEHCGTGSNRPPVPRPPFGSLRGVAGGPSSLFSGQRPNFYQKSPYKAHALRRIRWLGQERGGSIAAAGQGGVRVCRPRRHCVDGHTRKH